jgi:hypothetical protein
MTGENRVDLIKQFFYPATLMSEQLSHLALIQP